jgi:hypothetical protein
MRPLLGSWLIVGVLASLIGCGSRSAPSPSASDGSSGPAAGLNAMAPAAQTGHHANGHTAPGGVHVAALPPVNCSPDEVVVAFLGGMRSADSNLTAALLTAVAQQETVKHNWPVQPPGAPEATYQLGHVSYLDPNRSLAQVPCVWTEPDGEGGKLQFEVLWVLRQQQDGWRVAGFATEIVPGRPPVFFNFEDIASLKAAQEQAESDLAEMSGVSGEPAEVAGRPTSPGSVR